VDDKESLALLGCQLDKYAEEHGKKEAKQYFMKGIGDAMKEKGDVQPLQEQLIEEEGISCTRSEMASFREG
jgi:hypothetical protein